MNMPCGVCVCVQWYVLATAHRPDLGCKKTVGGADALYQTGRAHCTACGGCPDNFDQISIHLQADKEFAAMAARLTSNALI